MLGVTYRGAVALFRPCPQILYGIFHHKPGPIPWLTYSVVIFSLADYQILACIYRSHESSESGIAVDCGGDRCWTEHRNRKNRRLRVR